MSREIEWDVIREHEGDRFYKTGDTRIGTREELGHLSPKCLVPRETVAASKAEPELLNKAESAAPAHKAATRRKAK